MKFLNVVGFDCSPMTFSLNGQGITLVSKLDDSDNKQQAGEKNSR